MCIRDSSRVSRVKALIRHHRCDRHPVVPRLICVLSTSNARANHRMNTTISIARHRVALRRLHGARARRDDRAPNANARASPKSIRTTCWPCNNCLETIEANRPKRCPLASMTITCGCVARASASVFARRRRGRSRNPTRCGASRRCRARRARRSSRSRTRAMSMKTRASTRSARAVPCPWRAFEGVA